MDDTPLSRPSRPSTTAGDIARLRLELAAISPQTTVEQAADLFLQPELARLLSLPVVEDDQPVGTISRHQLNGIFLRRFGREIFGPRPVYRVMNAAPLVVDVRTPLEQAAEYVTTRMGSPLTEDFVVVEDGRYSGMGLVMDLLAALRARVEASAGQLSTAYEHLKASQTQLVQSEKMASLGQMVAGVAHEINTPLGYVRNNVEMIQGVFAQTGELLAESDQLVDMLAKPNADLAQISQQSEHVRAMLAELRDSGVLEDTAALFDDTLHGVDTIKELVVNMRNFSRLDQARQDRVSLNDCLDQTLVIANNVLKSKVEVIRRYGDIPEVLCSPSQINQILLNLMTNAAQAIEHDQGKLLLRTEHAGAWVRVHVQDNGKGIPEEHLARVFDPFFTTKPVGQGTGLGLSISFQIAQAHGGRIDVVSAPGRGTKFVLSLPVDSAAA